LLIKILKNFIAFVSLLSGRPVYIVVDELTGISQRLRITMSDVPIRVVACPPTNPPQDRNRDGFQKAVFGMLDDGGSLKAE
jgi:hypothetical protein